MVLTKCVLLLLLCGVIHSLEPKKGRGTRRDFLETVIVLSAEEETHEGTFPVLVSLNSHLDRIVNHDSQQPEPSPTNQHPRFSSLKTKLEDSPSKDMANRFVNLEHKSNNFIEEEKMELTDNRKLTFALEKKTDLKMLKRSKRDLKKQIEELTDNYKTEKVKQCCRDVYDHYMKHWDCYGRLIEMEKEQGTRCYKAFEMCCIHVRNHFTKTYFQPGTTSYCVSMPKFWKVAVPQIVEINIHGFKPESYNVQIMLLSYPDKNVTYDSQEYQWSSTDGTEAVLSLLLKQEDLPDGDELEKFVYLVIVYKDQVLEEKVPLLDLRVTHLDLKKPEGSPEGLKSEIETLASKYDSRRANRTCLDGHNHYKKESECQSRLAEFEKEGLLGLYRVFQKCCLHAREYTHRLANTQPEQYNINRECV